MASALGEALGYTGELSLGSRGQADLEADRNMVSQEK